MNGEQAPAARIFLRPIGSPLTLGMSGLAIASLVQSGYDLHWVSASEALHVGLILVGVPFVLQTLACVFAYLARDGVAGAALGVLSTSWLAVGLMHITSSGGHRVSALGLMLLASGSVLLLSASAMSTAKRLPGAVFGVEAIRYLLAGSYSLGGPSSLEQAAGIIGLIVVAAAAYCVLAFDLESQHHRALLPTFRRAGARAAAEGVAPEAIGDLVHEPGVRQRT